ncbi:hypothetical protein OE88DRAFT_1391167 [Heliocybe sulcata]|uniref:F-box domain-containing protein n=1 Tax=Heliocybe sulcata TaxID=5364 RepID=A0A5C3N5M7_9AGAM|nr:hypothetical protein OE88DRAFT_1391167 [Heliocybe sulcata]
MLSRLARTLARRPDLCRIVQLMSVSAVDDRATMRGTSQIYPWPPRNVADLLAKCPHVRSLLLFDVPKGERSGLLSNAAGASLPTKAVQGLTFLALSGPLALLAFQGTRIPFPVLEELLLGDSQVRLGAPGRSPSWSTFTALRVLRLFNMSFPSLASLPSARLEVLELSNVAFQDPLRSIRPEYHESLKTLRVAGSMPPWGMSTIDFMQHIDYSRLNRLEHLAIVYDKGERLAPAGRSRSLVVEESDYLRFVFLTNELVAPIADTLENPRLLPSLQVLQLLGGRFDAVTAGYIPAARTVQRLCLARGVTYMQPLCAGVNLVT